MPLTDTFLRQVKYSGAPAGNKHTDCHGMYLLVKAAGKYWRMNFRYAGKQKTSALGVYPEVSLAKARKRRVSYSRMALIPVRLNRTTRRQRYWRKHILLKLWLGSG